MDTNCGIFINSRVLADVIHVYEIVKNGLEPKKSPADMVEHIYVHEFPFWSIYFKDGGCVSSGDYRANAKKAIYKMLRICFILEDEERTNRDKKWFENFKKEVVFERNSTRDYWLKGICMRLGNYNVGDEVKININGSVTRARIIQKNRVNDFFLKLKYIAKNYDVKVKPVGARARFVSPEIEVIEKY